MSKIEWTEQTWNPIIGCSKVSAGCKNCYAEKMAYRLANIKNTSYYENVLMDDNYPEYQPIPEWNGKTHLAESQLNKPFKRKKPTMYFICSMGDLFHESVPFGWIDRIIRKCMQSKQHVFQILTKRPERMLEYFDYFYSKGHEILPNVWLGITAENQEMANERISILLDIPAKVRFLSCEPLLSEIKIPWYEGWVPSYYDPDNSGCYPMAEPMIIGLDWVICGGESGHNSRPLHPNWVRSLRDQCKAANVPFFFKQWGEFTHSIVDRNGECQFFKVGKKIAGSELDGKIHKELPKCTK